jgi:hypothetical protein
MSGEIVSQNSPDRAVDLGSVQGSDAGVWPLTCGFSLSGRRDLNPRPLDPQLHNGSVTGHQLVPVGPVISANRVQSMSSRSSRCHLVRCHWISSVTTAVTTLNQVRVMLSSPRSHGGVRGSHQQP